MIVQSVVFMCDRCHSINHYSGEVHLYTNVPITWPVDEKGQVEYWEEVDGQLLCFKCMTRTPAKESNDAIPRG